MAQSTLTPAAKSLAVATPALTLRVCGTPQDGRLVRLQGAKCSIGSDTQCTLRLRAPGVCPMHCLIIRGPERTIVRRWADDTRLNGQPFTTALLAIGDRLAVGSVEFEVVDGIPSQPEASLGEAAPPEATFTEEAVQPNQEDAGNRQSVTAAESRTAASHGRIRARRLLTRLREVRQESEVNAMRLARLEEEHRKLQEQSAAAQVQAAAAAAQDWQRSSEAAQMLEAVKQQRSVLEEQRRELEEARAKYEEDRTELHSERSTFSQAWSDFEQEHAALASQRLLLQQELRTFEEHKHALTLERIDWQTDTSRAEADIANLRDELDRRAAALEKQRLDLEATSHRLEETESRLKTRQDELQRSENELSERRQASEQQRLALESARNELERERHAIEQARSVAGEEREDLEKARSAFEQSRSELEQNRLEVEQARGELERSRLECEQIRGKLEQNRLELEQARVVAEQARGDLERDREALAKERARLESDLKKLFSEQAALAGERQKVEALRNQDQTNEDELSRRLTEQAHLLTDATERLNRLTEELKHQQDLLDAVRIELDEERAQWDAERARMQRDHHEQVAELQAQLNRGSAISDAQLPGESPSPAAGGDVFSRLRSMALLKAGPAADEASEAACFPPETHGPASDDAADEIRSSVTEEPNRLPELSEADSASVSHSSAFAPPAVEEEESIDNYMAQLLKRVRGVSSGYQAPAVHATEPPAHVADPGLQLSSESPSPQQPVAVQEVPTKLARRSTAPELSSDLAAMRELANLSARAAIDKHAYRNWGRAAFGKLTIAVLAAGTGAGAVYYAPAPDSMLMYAGLSSFVVTLFWLLQAGILVKNVFQATRRREQFMNAVTDDVGEAADSHSFREEALSDDDEAPPAQLIPVHDHETYDDQAVDQPYDDAAEYDGQYAAETAIESGYAEANGAYPAELENTESKIARDETQTQH